MASKNTDNDVPQIQIRLVTKQQHYAVPDYPLSVPASVVISDLNTLVNELLKETVTSTGEVEFDFIVCAEFLRTTLFEHINERGISVEDVINIEYIEKHPPPEPQDCLIHDDWVSAVAMCEKWILTGCYDNTLHLWTAKGKHHLTITGHTSPIKAVAWISLDGEIGTFVSASQDQTAIIWRWNIDSNTAESMYICKGHERSIEAVGVNSASDVIATGSWDTMLKIWSTCLSNDENEDGESSLKRPKTKHNKIKVPLKTMKGHKEAISGVVWTGKAEIVTSSWDHTLKVWDSELGGIKHELAGNKSFFDVDYSPLSNLLIAASADKHVRLYDLRSTEGTVVKSMFTSHTQWVQSVRWSTTQEHLFMSGAHDNSVKLWDTRSPKAPLFDLEGHEDKVLSCNWSNPKYLLSGGADNTVRIFKSKYSAI